MGLLFENANTESIDKKWYATSVFPIYTPLQGLSLNNKSSCAKITPMGSQSTGVIHPNKRREYRLVRPKFVWGYRVTVTPQTGCTLYTTAINTR